MSVCLVCVYTHTRIRTHARTRTTDTDPRASTRMIAPTSTTFIDRPPITTDPCTQRLHNNHCLSWSSPTESAIDPAPELRAQHSRMETLGTAADQTGSELELGPGVVCRYMDESGVLRPWLMDPQDLSRCNGRDAFEVAAPGEHCVVWWHKQVSWLMGGAMRYSGGTAVKWHGGTVARWHGGRVVAGWWQGGMGYDQGSRAQDQDP